MQKQESAWSNWVKPGAHGPTIDFVPAPSAKSSGLHPELHRCKLFILGSESKEGS